MPYTHYSAAEVAARGEALYEQRIRPHVEATHQGQFVVVDIETGDYEVDADVWRRRNGRWPSDRTPSSMECALGLPRRTAWVPALPRTSHDDRTNDGTPR